MIELRGRSSIAEMEALVARIVSAPRDADILLPNSLKQKSFAASAAYMQLLVTWARHCPDGRLRLHVQEDDGDERAQVTLERALKADHAMLAAALAGDVRARRGIRDLTPLAAPILRERFARMDRSGTTLRKGGKTFAMCLDDSAYEAPPLLYRDRPANLARDPELLGREGFGSLAQQIQERLNAGIGGGGAFAGVGGLSSTLYELFKNTHEWARSDAVEIPYPPESSARGVRVERHNVDAALELGMVKDQPALRDFFSHPSLAPRDGRRRFVELTVFDSGPGVASRRLLVKHPERADPDVGAELSTLRECLRKHVTSSTEDAQGVGLHKVCKDLTDLSAFLWLRTGRLSLYRDFVAMPYDPEADADEPYLLDWSAGLGGVTENAPATGSFFTALLPIGHDPNQTAL